MPASKIAPKVPKRPGAQCVSQATRAKRKKEEQDGPQAALCRTRACVVFVHAFLRSAELPPCIAAEPHHEPPRSQGGTDRDTVPLCKQHHTERHAMGKAPFEAKHGVDLLDLVGAMRLAVGRG